MKHAVRYTVKVTAVLGYEAKQANEWGVVDHVASGEINKAGDPVLKPKMGFLPEHTKRFEREVQVFEQTVDTPVDLARTPADGDEHAPRRAGDHAGCVD